MGSCSNRFQATQNTTIIDQHCTYQHHQFGERYIVAFSKLDAATRHVVPETAAHGGGSHSLLSGEDRSQQRLVGAAEGSEVFDEDGIILSLVAKSQQSAVR